MKKANRFALAVVLALFVATIPLSRAQGAGGMEMGKKPTAGAQTAHKASGVVKNVDPKAGTVTIAHGPIKSLQWPAMTMTFAVKDKALLGKLAQDRKVEFEFVQQGSDYVITSAR